MTQQIRCLPPPRLFVRHSHYARAATVRTAVLLAMFCFWRGTLGEAATTDGTEYVLANNNNSVANSATLYRLDLRTGHLRQVAVLATGGQGLGVELDLSGIQQAISKDEGCIFLLDTKSSDIAAYRKTIGYTRVGNYFNQNLISGVEGDSIALTPNGRFLYASYTNTGNVGAWSIDHGCRLTLTTVAQGVTFPGPLGVTTNGKYLLTRSGGGGVEFAIDQLTGGLTYIGTTAFTSGACARQNACLPYGIQISKDSKLAMFSSFAPDIRRDHMIPVMLSAQITPSGLINPKVRNLAVENDLRLNIFPFLSAAAYKGNGAIYLGITSGGTYNPGVLTADFTEKPVHFAVTNSTVTNPQVGNIAVTGNLLIMAQYPNQISVFRIKKNGSLKLLSTTTINEQGEGLFSLSVFPNTR